MPSFSFGKELNVSLESLLFFWTEARVGKGYLQTAVDHAMVEFVRVLEEGLILQGFKDFLLLVEVLCSLLIIFFLFEQTKALASGWLCTFRVVPTVRQLL